ncbi:hypothetical protein [Xanthomonas campestris]|nr:hypothetical protein [Xanthomonas campestris]
MAIDDTRHRWRIASSASAGDHDAGTRNARYGGVDITISASE